MSNKCPYCGSNQFSKLDTGNPNIKYVLTQVDVSSNTFLATQGMPVDVFGCGNCKGIVLANQNLEYHE